MNKNLFQDQSFIKGRAYYRAKKKFGQHFLKNHLVVKKIVRALELKPGETVVEIGPGTGVLTDELLETGAKVVAVEKDRDLFPILKQRFGQNENFQLVEADILDFDPRVSSFTFQASSFKVCGNLPYYLSGKILELILEQWREPSLTRPKLELAVFMLQKEVCQKLVAAPPQMTILSVINRFLAEFRILFLVSRKNFSPQPKVDSAVVKIVP